MSIDGEFHRDVYRSEPSAEDISRAKSSIQQHTLAKSALEERIAELLRQAHQFRREQAAHDEAIRRSKGVITLARRIPDEILASIFEKCIIDGYTRMPLVVSQVCSAWRRAAMSPRVWSYLFIQCDGPEVIPRTRLWLSRAKEASLFITISTAMDEGGRFANIFDLISPTASRWHTLDILTADPAIVNYVLLRLTQTQMPILRDVIINTHICTETVDGQEVAQDIPSLAHALSVERAPMLEFMSFKTRVVPFVSFPSHLCELFLDIEDSLPTRPLSAADILSLLANVPQLKKLTLLMPVNPSHPYIHLPNGGRDASRIVTVTLPELSTLKIHGPKDLNEVLPHLRTPSLRELYLRSKEEATTDREETLGLSLLRFLHAVGPHLPPSSRERPWMSALVDFGYADPALSPVNIELLELYDIDLTAQAFEVAFQALPNLRELRLHESTISDSTIRLLCAGPGYRGLCPRLTKLDLRWCGDLHGDVLVELVRTRNIGVADMGRNTEVDNDMHINHMDVDSRQDGSAPIEEVAVLNCCLVEERDVLDLAWLTVCRVILRNGDDHCRGRNCCNNPRYRTRLRSCYAVLTNTPLHDDGGRERIHLIL